MPSPPKAVNQDGRRKRILVVDDSIGMRVYMRTILSAAGFACIEAADGLEAFDLILREPFDLVVTDLDMPRMNGFELLAAIGLLPAGRQRPPVLVVSARIDEDLMRRRPELKLAARVLDKPAGAGELLDAIAATLPIARASCT